MIEKILNYVPLVIALLVVLPGLRAMHYLLLARYPDMGIEKRLPRHLAMVAAAILGVVVIVMTLPIGEARGQVIAIIGLVLSGLIAFSSTTIVSNLMAGVMMRITRPFRTGDFVQVNEFFGRVTEQGLFDTEVQTEDRDLLAVPNFYMIANPVKVIRSSGTIVHTRLSLGYDVHHADVERLLIDAAGASGLDQPFVHIDELGDFSITYRVSGLLTEVKSLLTTRSNLRRAVLDTLHQNGIEILSPNWMNQRPMPKEDLMIPDEVRRVHSESAASAEAIAFDKAKEAEEKEKKSYELKKEIEELKASLADATTESKTEIKGRIQALQETLIELTNHENEERG